MRMATTRPSAIRQADVTARRWYPSAATVTRASATRTAQTVHTCISMLLADLSQSPQGLFHMACRNPLSLLMHVPASVHEPALWPVPCCAVCLLLSSLCFAVKACCSAGSSTSSSSRIVSLTFGEPAACEHRTRSPSAALSVARCTLPVVLMVQHRKSIVADEYVPCNEPRARQSNQRGQDATAVQFSKGERGDVDDAPLASRQNRLAGANRAASTQKPPVRTGTRLLVFPLTLDRRHPSKKCAGVTPVSLPSS